MARRAPSVPGLDKPSAPRKGSGPERMLVRVALALSALALALRFSAAGLLGYGDNEALYASYALHPQPAYLDHPGFIGTIAKWLGTGGAPEPIIAHQVTAAWATAIPWLAGVAAWALGASRRGALLTVLAALIAPPLAVGLFAFSPDLPLTTAWLGTLACVGYALRRPPSHLTVWAATLTAGLLVGIAGLSKLSGVLVGLGILLGTLTSPQRSRWRTAAPWLAVLAALVVLSPVFVWELQRGWPLFHRIIQEPPRHTGGSIIAVAKQVAGQILYVTPLYLAAAIVLWKHLWRERRRNAALWILHCVTWTSAIPLLAVGLWTGRTEPNWILPCYLSLLLYVGVRPILSRTFAWATLASGGLISVLAFLWATTPLAPTYLGAAYSPKWDIANDMHSWGPGRQLLAEAVSRTILDEGRPVPVVGPHWMVCAQARAALSHAAQVPVGCNTPWRDDFDDWLPREKWLRSPTILYVYDSRFGLDPSLEFPDRDLRRLQKVHVRRGGRSVRTIYVATLIKREATARWSRIRSAAASHPHGLLHASGAAPLDPPP